MIMVANSVTQRSDLPFALHAADAKLICFIPRPIEVLFRNYTSNSLREQLVQRLLGALKKHPVLPTLARKPWLRQIAPGWLARTCVRRMLR